jgi:hypothetical protein
MVTKTIIYAINLEKSVESRKSKQALDAPNKMEKVLITSKGASAVNTWNGWRLQIYPFYYAHQ